MGILANIVTSKLWVLGSSKIVFGDSLWQFYYSIEGVRTKTCHVLFYDPNKNRIYLKSPILDLKVKNVIIQKCLFVSNVYKLLIEWTATGLSLWKGSCKTPTKVNCGIVSPAKKETYFCSPPIMIKDTFAPLEIHAMQHSAIIGDDDDNVNKQQTATIMTIAGYTVYRAASLSAGHKSHFKKTWVPQVTVDSTTFDCSFEVVYSSKRRQEECLECALIQEHGVHSPAVSNLLINH